MAYQLCELGQVDQGKIVEISLDYSASIKIMDHTNYYNFKKGGKHKFIGGYIEKSPYEVVIPYASRWFAVFDIDGLAEKVCSGVRILSSSSKK